MSLLVLLPKAPGKELAEDMRIGNFVEALSKQTKKQPNPTPGTLRATEQRASIVKILFVIPPHNDQPKIYWQDMRPTVASRAGTN